MKPRRFRYLAPTSLAEAVDALAFHGDDAKALAGGQSLGPLLNLRLASPEVIVDLERISELSAPIREEGDCLEVASMTRQRDMETSPSVRRWVPLLAQALPFVAHRTIRNRGTLGGSLAHADPAAELPAVAVAAGATIIVRGAEGGRRLDAGDFFEGFFTTVLEPGELIEAVQFPKVQSREGTSWMEFAPRRGDFAVVGVAARLRLSESGVIEAARIVYSGVSDVPWHDEAVASLLVGSSPDPEVLSAAADLAAERCQTTGDATGSARYRKSLMAHLGSQALAAAVDEARGRS